MPDRREFLLSLAASLAALALPGRARAHHGWSWAENGEFQLTGIIRDVYLGYPHGELKIQVDDELWTAEIGQPPRNAGAGLDDDMLRPGLEITLLGHRSADPAELRMKAERVILAGRTHDLYPGRS